MDVQQQELEKMKIKELKKNASACWMIFTKSSSSSIRSITRFIRRKMKRERKDHDVEESDRSFVCVSGSGRVNRLRGEPRVCLIARTKQQAHRARPIW